MALYEVFGLSPVMLNRELYRARYRNSSPSSPDAVKILHITAGADASPHSEKSKLRYFYFTLSWELGLKDVADATRDTATVALQ